jgi:hypothetical protein
LPKPVSIAETTPSLTSVAVICPAPSIVCPSPLVSVVALVVSCRVVAAPLETEHAVARDRRAGIELHGGVADAEWTGSAR